MSILPPSEIKAITSLLKSSDDGTFKLLEEQLKTFDIKLLREIDSVIPLDDAELKNGFLKLVSKIKKEHLKKDFSNWSKNHSNNLKEGIFLLAMFENPLLDKDYYFQLLNDWSSDISKNLKEVKLKNDPTSIINEINHFLFMELGFKGNKGNYYDPQNSYIHKIIDNKSGNPILLSIIYLIIAEDLNLPFSGVNMPAHFLVQYVDKTEPIYIDPFNQGEIITRSVCQERIKSLKLTWQEEYLASPANKQILIRTMHNLINIYHNEEQFELKEYLEEYMRILKT
ncbi:MAG: hypothetical protein HYY52_08245 [Candidatus Melainabacteria bacterium]|nr:hypothetical protein [Candidatus Melainabacteria bacterium]